MLESYIKELEPIIKDYFSKDSSGHDIGHLERTMNTALYLQEKEGGDRIVIGIAAFLHDIHRIMQNEKGKFVTPEESLPVIKEMLSKIALRKEQVDKICYCIKYHENYNWNGENIRDLNTLILQDADNLDAIGAIGIGRAFTYGGANNMPIYDSKIPLSENNDFTENKNDITTIHHFYHKLFKLGDNMNTKTAKELATKRIDYMKGFVQEFLNEWNAKY